MHIIQIIVEGQANPTMLWLSNDKTARAQYEKLTAAFKAYHAPYDENEPDREQMLDLQTEDTSFCIDLNTVISVMLDNVDTGFDTVVGREFWKHKIDFAVKQKYAMYLEQMQQTGTRQ